MKTNMGTARARVAAGRLWTPIGHGHDGYCSVVLKEIFMVNGNSFNNTIAEGYLAWKYGLQSLLQSTHPYAIEPPRVAA